MKQIIRIVSPTEALIAGIFLLVTVLAEITTIFSTVIVAAFIDGILLLAMVNLAYFSRSAGIRKILLPLLPVPLLRILSLAIPIPHITPIFWYLLVGIPLLLATFILVRVIDLPELSVKLAFRKWIFQILFGLLGIPIGMLAALVLPAPSLLIPGKTVGWIISGAVILTLFSALTEEIIFRGLVQKVMSDTFGRAGLIISAGLYASMTLGTLSPAYIIFFGLTAMLFAIWVKRSGSLWGVIIAHSLVNILFLLLLSH